MPDRILRLTTPIFCSGSDGSETISAVKDAPKMYLVGVDRLSASQKKLLDERNIVCVDLFQYPGIWPR